MAAGRLGRFLRLPAGDMVLGAAAVVLLVLAVMALRLLPCRRAMALFGARATGQRIAADRVAAAVRRGAAAVPAARCLAQGMAFIALARMAGAAGTLVIGARRADAGGLEAHAWIEDGGKAVLGDNGQLSTYSRFRGGRTGEGPDAPSRHLFR